jgi:hypothetical protein
MASDEEMAFILAELWVSNLSIDFCKVQNVCVLAISVDPQEYRRYGTGVVLLGYEGFRKREEFRA